MARFINFFLFSLFITISLLVLTDYVQADDSDKLKELMENSTPEVRADFLTNKMRELLNLTGEQSKQVREINLKYAQINERIYHSNESLLSKYMKMKEIGNQKDNDLKKILNEEQYRKYLAKKKEMIKEIDKNK